MKTFSRILVGLSLAALTLSYAQTSSASVLVFKLGGVDITSDGGGGDGSVLAKDVLEMNFSTYDSGVYLDIYFNNLSGVTTGSKVESILFNYDGPIPNNFAIQAATGTALNGFGSGYTVNQDAFSGFGIASKDQEFKYGDNGLFDLKVFFDTESASALKVDQAVRLSITATDWTPDIAFFDELSTDAKFKAAMHLLTAENGNSGHYGGQSGFGGDGNPVPEPGAIAIWSMIGLSAVGGAAWRRRKNSKAA